jgi:TRAP-type C4-dicarboxylate transport system permease small subunit
MFVMLVLADAASDDLRRFADAMLSCHILYFAFSFGWGAWGGANTVLSPLLLADASDFVKLLFYTLLMLRLLLSCNYLTRC